MTLNELAAKISAACPGAAVENTGRGWRYVAGTAATADQIAAADAIMSAFNAATPPVPLSVKMWQAKAALAAGGKLDPANAAVARVQNPALAIAWEYATDLSRDSPALAAIGAAIGLTPADIDALFIQASNIKV